MARLHQPLVLLLGFGPRLDEWQGLRPSRPTVRAWPACEFQCVGEGPSGTADRVDTPRTRACFARSSVHQTWQVLHITRFCALTAAVVVDGGINGACLPLVEKTLYACYESLAHGGRCFRHYAVAVRVHRVGDQTILFRITGGILGVG